MASAGPYRASPIKRRRRTKAEIEEIKSAIYSVVAADRPMTVRQVFYRDIKHLERLVSSIVHALQMIPRDKGGKPHQRNLDALARRLGGIYLDFTGKPFRAPLSIKAGKERPGKFPA